MIFEKSCSFGKLFRSGEQYDNKHSVCKLWNDNVIRIL